MSEQRLWQNVRPILEPLCPVRVENPAWPGTPDVAHIYGWLELKHMPEWPKRGKTPLRVDHFTTEQRAFLRGWNRKGGVADLLIQVGREYLLLDGMVAANKLGHVPRTALLDNSIAHWPSLRYIRDDLLRVVESRRPEVFRIYGS